MKNSGKSLLIGTGIMGITVLIGIFGYTLAGWSLIDAVFMVVITIFGVGYGEVHPAGTELRIFTMLIILAGCTSLIYLVGGFIQFLTEGEIQRMLGKRRMTQEIQKLNHHVIICGLGRIGRSLGEKLTQAGRPFLIIESNPVRVQEAEEQNWLVLQGDATEEGVLEEAGTTRAKVLATVLPNDATNVFITLSARNLNPNLEIIARGEIPSTEPKLFQAGASRVVLPAHIGAERIAGLVLHPSTDDLLANNDALKDLDEQLGGLGIHIQEMVIDDHSQLSGKTLAQLESLSNIQLLVVAIHREDGRDIVHPQPDVVLQPNDHLIYICHTGADADLLKHVMKR